MTNDRLTLGLVLTYQCNLSCRYCLRKAEKSKKEIPFTYLRRLVAQAHRAGCRSAALTGGEASLYSNFFEICKILGALGWTVLVESNGLLITDKWVKKILELIPRERLWVLISLDSKSAENHDYCRGVGTHSAAIKAIKLLATARINVATNAVISEKNLFSPLDLYQYLDQLRLLGVKRCSFSPIVPAGKNTHDKLTISDKQLAEMRNLFKKAKKHYQGIIDVRAMEEHKAGKCPRLEEGMVTVSYKGFHPCLYLDDVIAPLTGNSHFSLNYLSRLKRSKKLADNDAGINYSDCRRCVRHIRKYL